MRFALTKDTPYLAFTGKVWGTFRELYDDKWPRYIDNVYVFPTLQNIKPGFPIPR